MTVYTYGAKTGMRSEVSNDVDSMDLYRSADTYHVLVHNLSSGEFGSLDFSNVDNIDSFRVDLTPITQYTNGTGQGGDLSAGTRGFSGGGGYDHRLT